MALGSNEISRFSNRLYRMAQRSIWVEQFCKELHGFYVEVEIYYDVLTNWYTLKRGGRVVHIWDDRILYGAYNIKLKSEGKCRCLGPFRTTSSKRDIMQSGHT